MSDTRRRARKRREPGSSPSGTPSAASGTSRATPAILAAWHWKTFPVYFALATGLFVGVYIGGLGGSAAANGNGTFFFVSSSVAALLFALGLSRFVARWIVKRKVQAGTPPR